MAYASGLQIGVCHHKDGLQASQESLALQAALVDACNEMSTVWKQVKVKQRTLGRGDGARELSGCVDHKVGVLLAAVGGGSRVEQADALARDNHVSIIGSKS
jgi:hypothetical protein